MIRARRRAGRFLTDWAREDLVLLRRLALRLALLAVAGRIAGALLL